VQVQTGTLLAQQHHDRRDQGGDARRECADTHITDIPGLPRGQVGAGTSQLFLEGGRVPKDDPSGPGEHDAAATALEQWYPQFAAQTGDLLGDGRRCEMQPNGRCRQRPGLIDGLQDPQLAQIHCEVATGAFHEESLAGLNDGNRPRWRP